jgi:hypothetical protein
LRLAWLALPPWLLEPVMEAKRLADRHNPVLDQLVLADLLTSGAFDRHLRRCRCATAAGATGWAPPLPSTRRHSGWPVSPPACTRSCPSPSRARPSRRSSPTPPPTRSPLTASGLLALGSPTSRWPGHRLRQPTRARRPAADLRRRGAG